ncbi:MAG: M17 family peptidase N-terminal domain-containing protein, partial [Bacteriovorax sp.]|nr:M17 family peptidase N-terminal domain-containing protein [Bacteriovorax sp.]
MKINLSFEAKQSGTELHIFSCFNKTQEVKVTKKVETKKSEKILSHSHWSAELAESFEHSVASKHYKGDCGEMFSITMLSGATALIVGLGDKTKLTKEILRRQIATVYKAVSAKYEDATIHLDGFIVKGHAEESIGAMVESLHMAAYTFDRHLAVK